MTTNLATRIDEIAPDIYRIHTSIPPSAIPGGFSFNQYLIRDELPLLFHTGSRKMFPAVRQAIARVIEPARLRYVAFSHWEQDECGALNELLSIASEALPLCSGINAMVNSDGMDRSPRVAGDGERISLGKHCVRWLDTPHLPHGWESGLLFDETTSTLFCGDLLTQPGECDTPLVEIDILGPSEELRARLDYFAHGRLIPGQLARLSALEPRVLACMHGHSWSGGGAELIGELARSLRAQS